METTETFVPTSPPAPILTAEALVYLRQAGKWASFLGIIGFIFCAFSLIGAFTITTVFAKLSALIPPDTATVLTNMAGFFIFIIIATVVIYFFFSLFLVQFGSGINKGLKFNDTAHLTHGLGKLKSFFKLWGILTIIIISLYLLLIIIGIVAGLGAMHR